MDNINTKYNTGTIERQFKHRDNTGTTERQYRQRDNINIVTILTQEQQRDNINPGVKILTQGQYGDNKETIQRE